VSLVHKAMNLNLDTMKKAILMVAGEIAKKEQTLNVTIPLVEYKRLVSVGSNQMLLRHLHQLQDSGFVQFTIGSMNNEMTVSVYCKWGER